MQINWSNTVCPEIWLTEFADTQMVTGFTPGSHTGHGSTGKRSDFPRSSAHYLLMPKLTNMAVYTGCAAAVSSAASSQSAVIVLASSLFF